MTPMICHDMKDHDNDDEVEEPKETTCRDDEIRDLPDQDAKTLFLVNKAAPQQVFPVVRSHLTDHMPRPKSSFRRPTPEAGPNGSAVNPPRKFDSTKSRPAREPVSFNDRIPRSAERFEGQRARVSRSVDRSEGHRPKFSRTNEQRDNGMAFSRTPMRPDQIPARPRPDQERRRQLRDTDPTT